MLSTKLWKRLFNADAGVIGRTIDLDGSPAVVIGVMPEGFSYPDWAEMWCPLALEAAQKPVIIRRDYHVDSRAIGRLAPGVSIGADADHPHNRPAPSRVSVPRRDESDWTGAQ